jgi:hypothetical protein
LIPIRSSDSAQERRVRALVTDWFSRLTPRNQIDLQTPNVCFNSFDAMMRADIYGFDFAKLRRVEERARGLSRTSFLQHFFATATKAERALAPQEKWYRILDCFLEGIRHSPVGQPMYPDKTMVTDPLLLLLLGDGRCGQAARVIADLALVNGYEARLVQLAAHMVAEVKWDGHWHWIDADAGFPVAMLRELFPELPSTYELSTTPYKLDRLPARGWTWGTRYLRTLDGHVMAKPSWYPGTLLISSTYFGDSLWQNKFSGDPATPRKGVTYLYKEGTREEWEKDRYWGWQAVQSEEGPMEAIPVEYAVEVPHVSAPPIIYAQAGLVAIPVRFLPAFIPRCDAHQVFACAPDCAGFTYEIRVSSQSRGWDYDFRNYKKMPQSGPGDLARVQQVNAYPDGSLGTEIQLQYAGDVYLEVMAEHGTYKARGTFAWPSSEAYVRVIPANFKPWRDPPAASA